MDSWETLFEMLILLGSAFALGAIAERFRQSAIIGYMLAGVLLGPNAFNLVSGLGGVSGYAELGVSLLLFSIGIEFSWRRLRSLGNVAFGGGALQVIATGLAVLAAASAFVGTATALLMGVIVALSSTAGVVRLLADRAEVDSVHGRSAIGVLLFQDMAVVPLVVLVGFLGRDSSLGSPALYLLRMLGATAGLMLIFFIAIRFILPKVFLSPGLRRNHELSVLLAAVTAVGAAWVAHEIGISPAVGAFIAGMLLAESPFATQVRSNIGGLKALFIAVFFSSIGMLADPAWIMKNWPLVATCAAAVFVCKSIITSVSLLVFGVSVSCAVAAGVSLAQIGEFSFVIAIMARGYGVMSEMVFSLVISVTIITLFITPYMVSYSLPVGKLAGRLVSRDKEKSRDSDDEGDKIGGALIIGFGLVGRMVADSLSTAKVSMKIIDMNPEAVTAARGYGAAVVVGNATQAEVLEHAGVSGFDTVVVTVPDPGTSRMIVENVKSAAPGVLIIARARYNKFHQDIKRAGADVVVNEEMDVGRSLAAAVIEAVGRLNPGA